MQNKRITILLVDDNLQNLQVLAEIIQSMGYEPVLATDGQQALEYTRREIPDMILLDIMMPDQDGFSVCRNLKNNPRIQDIPIIFLTAKTEIEDIVKGLNLGAVDYITKPFNAIELTARIRTHLELKSARDKLLAINEQLETAYQTIQDQNSRLREMMEQLEILSSIDPLTSLFNRRQMLSRIDEEIARQKRYHSHFSILLGDIDHFKLLNDQYGHDCGDKVLVKIAQNLKNGLRETDAIARWGGEEFLILLSGAPVDIACMTAERLRMIVATESYIWDNQTQIRISITIGVTEHREKNDFDTTLKEADQALYQGKQLGRNRVVPYSGTPQTI